MHDVKGTPVGAFIKKIGEKRKNKGKILLALFFKLQMLLTFLKGFNVPLWIFLSAELIL